MSQSLQTRLVRFVGAVGASALCLVLSACLSRGITQQQAVDLALREIGPAATGVQWVKNGRLAAFSTNATLGDDPDRQVWAVRLSGNWPGPCPWTPFREPGWCDVTMHNATVVLDLVDGEVLEFVMN